MLLKRACLNSVIVGNKRVFIIRWGDPVWRLSGDCCDAGRSSAGWRSVLFSLPPRILKKGPIEFKGLSPYFHGRARIYSCRHKAN